MQAIRGKRRLAALLAGAAGMFLAACGDSPEPAALPVAPPETGACGDAGYLRTDLYGDLAGPVDWSAGSLDCEGMPRPDGAGARLRFAGLAGNQPVAVIIAMPGLERGMQARELGSNVTVIEEGSGRFFSTAGLDNCWTDVREQRETGDATHVYFVAGTLYCIAPLAQVNGDSSVTLRELEFGGYLDWDRE